MTSKDKIMELHISETKFMNLSVDIGICQLEISYKRQEISALICNHPLSRDAFDLEFTYKQRENKVLICKQHFFVI